MCNDWILAKKKMIAIYFADNEYMRNVAELAYNGHAYYQDELANWFESQQLFDLADQWRNRVRLNREQTGSLDD